MVLLQVEAQIVGMHVVARQVHMQQHEGTSAEFAAESVHHQSAFCQQYDFSNSCLASNSQAQWHDAGLLNVQIPKQSRHSVHHSVVNRMLANTKHSTEIRS